jgi:hypothetical protein
MAAFVIFAECVSVCVVWCCHAEESFHVIDPDVFAGLLPPDCEVFDSIQQ